MEVRVVTGRIFLNRSGPAGPNFRLHRSGRSPAG
jgi:hypothetical protein